MMQPSWMLVRGPMMSLLRSPRSTTPNQMLAPAPISTLPMMTALSAMKASGAIFGMTPPKGMSVPDERWLMRGS